MQSSAASSRSSSISRSSSSHSSSAEDDDEAEHTADFADFSKFESMTADSPTPDAEQNRVVSAQYKPVSFELWCVLFGSFNFCFVLYIDQYHLMVSESPPV